MVVLTPIPVYLEDPVQADHGAGPAHPGAAVHHDRPLFRAHAISERPDKSEKKRRGKKRLLLLLNWNKNLLMLVTYLSLYYSPYHSFFLSYLTFKNLLPLFHFHDDPLSSRLSGKSAWHDILVRQVLNKSFSYYGYNKWKSMWDLKVQVAQKKTERLCHLAQKKRFFLIEGFPKCGWRKTKRLQLKPFLLMLVTYLFLSQRQKFI